MITQRSTLTMSALLFLICIPLSQSWADIPPPKDYVETCTIAHQSQNGAECVECSASFESDDCNVRVEGEGFSKTCQTWGGSFWTEVWCRGGGKSPAEEKSDQTPTAPSSPAPSSDSTPSDSTPSKSKSCSQLDQPPMLLWITVLFCAILSRRVRNQRKV